MQYHQPCNIIWKMDSIIQTTYTNYYTNGNKISQIIWETNIKQDKLKGHRYQYTYWNGDNTYTVQRLQAYHHSTQLILIYTHMPCSIHLHETPAIASTYWLLIMICRFQSLAYKMKPPQHTHTFWNPIKITTHLTKRHQTHLPTVKIWKKDWNLYWLGLDTD